MSGPNPADNLLMRFEDGPLHGIGNICNLAGEMDFVVSRETYGWPLPKRLAVLTHPGVAQVAMWDANDPEESGLPQEIVGSPNRVIYLKVSESQITEQTSRLMRGAVYRLEE